MTAEYPTKVTTQLKTAVNNFSLNLTDDVGEDADEIFVGSTEGAPDPSGSFHIENEIIFYPAKTSIKFGPGLTRGADGTTKAVHLKTLAGGEVKFGPEAHFVNNLNDEVIATQTKLGITGAFNFVLTSAINIPALKANEIIVMAAGFNINGSSATLVDTAGTAAKCYAQHLSVVKTNWFDCPKFLVPADYDGGSIVITTCWRNAAASKKHSLGIRVASVATGEVHNPDLAAAYDLYNQIASDATAGKVTIRSTTVPQANSLMVAGKIWHCKFVIKDDGGSDADATLFDYVRIKWNKV